MDTEEVPNKPHDVCIPVAAQSHIKAMLKFAKLLHHRGFHITFVNTEFNNKRFLKSLDPNSPDGLPDFCCEAIPDGLPDKMKIPPKISLCLPTTSENRICWLPFVPSSMNSTMMPHQHPTILQ
ncbi:hypothetical protein C1H46_007709 [Malus baccata]|uniref:Uncharacterized protein n=1 Tax=Malus baccata TaxID=106549 RepID=A0A540N7Y3_MALBA|nr:hypothetical protein C1H46_007709 [Malus baccata]